MWAKSIHRAALTWCATISCTKMIPCLYAGRRVARVIVADAALVDPVEVTGSKANIRDFIEQWLTVCEMGILSMSISHIKELKYDF